MFDQKSQSFPALLRKTIASQHSEIPSGRPFWVNLVVTFPNNGDNHGRIVSKIFEKASKMAGLFTLKKEVNKRALPVVL